MTRLDLHIHTTASDGGCTPTEIVALARKRGLETIAITDHDTTEGVGETLAAARVGTLDDAPLYRPTVIPGIELSAEDAGGDVHMLGYYLNIEDSQLQIHLSKFRDDRAARAQQIVDKLLTLGIKIEYERVLAIAETGAKRGAIGRPHVARAMLERGYVQSVPEAFARYLNPGAPAYVARERLSPEGAIDLIHSAGGVAVLAHPVKVRDYRTMIARLAPTGLDGIEVVHPSCDENTRLDLRGLAERYGLIMTGGSDFHHPSEDGTVMLGALTPPEDAPRRLRERAERYRGG